MLCVSFVGTVPTLCILDVGTVNTFCILNVLTVPMFSPRTFWEVHPLEGCRSPSGMSIPSRAVECIEWKVEKLPTGSVVSPQGWLYVHIWGLLCVQYTQYTCTVLYTDCDCKVVS